jgi:hypothetical protein
VKILGWMGIAHQAGDFVVTQQSLGAGHEVDSSLEDHLLGSPYSLAGWRTPLTCNRSSRILCISARPNLRELVFRCAFRLDELDGLRQD